MERATVTVTEFNIVEEPCICAREVHRRQDLTRWRKHLVTVQMNLKQESHIQNATEGAVCSLIVTWSCVFLGSALKVHKSYCSCCPREPGYILGWLQNLGLLFMWFWCCRHARCTRTGSWNSGLRSESCWGFRVCVTGSDFLREVWEAIPQSWGGRHGFSYLWGGRC